MLRTLLKFVISIAAFTGSSIVSAHDYSAGDIEIGHPYTQATPPGVPNAAAYARFTNTGDHPDRLVAASSEAAEKVEIHESTVENGIARMRHLQRGIVIAAGETVEFAPRAHHFMLFGLTRRFVEGEKVKLTLTFEKQGDIEVDLAVAPLSAGGHGNH